MSCTGCATKFGFLKKEHGCPGCGFSYCGKCLNEQVALKSGEKPVAVCRNCASQRQVQPTSGTVVPPTQPSDLPPPSIRQAAKARAKSMGEADLNPDEKALRERLDQLKMTLGKGHPVTQTELETRLAKLKGQSFDEKFSQKPQYFAPDNRTPAQRADDLVKQMREEMEMQRRLSRPEVEMAERLARLKEEGTDMEEKPELREEDAPAGLTGETESQTELADVADEKELSEVERLMQQTQKEAHDEAVVTMKTLEKDKEIQDQLRRLEVQRKKPTKNIANEESISEGEDEEEEAEKLARMIVEEEEIANRLASLAPPPSTFGDESEEWEDELPWCCICTEDATLRCIGCGGDLYCRRCFREGHDQFDLSGHQTTPYNGKTMEN